MTTMNEERVGFEAAYASVAEGGWDSVKDMGIQMFKAGAAWQRTAAIPAEKPLPELMMASYHEAIGWNACRQALLAAAPATPAAQGAVPDVSAMAKVLSDRAASACCVDPDDNWKIYGQEYIEDVRAMLAAAPAHPAERQETVCPDCLDTGRQPGVYGPHKCRCHCNASAERQEREALHVWRATTRFGETCHFGAASTARAWAGENGTVERVDLTPVPELRAVERQEQGEVQRLRDVLDEYERQTKALPCQHEIPERGCSTYNWRMSVIRDLRAMLAASTEQEVGK